MKLIKAIVRPSKVEDIKDALVRNSISGITVTEVRGHGRQRGHSLVYRGSEHEVSLLPKMEIEVVVPNDLTDWRNRRRTSVRYSGRARANHPHRRTRHCLANPGTLKPLV